MGTVSVHPPKSGPARALWEADPDTPISEIPLLLESVDRWECSACGRQTFTKPERCGSCGTETFDRIVRGAGA